MEEVKTTFCSDLLKLISVSGEMATRWFVEVSFVAITPQLPFEVAVRTSPEMLHPAPGVLIW